MRIAFYIIGSDIQAIDIDCDLDKSQVSEAFSHCLSRGFCIVVNQDGEGETFEIVSAHNLAKITVGKPPERQPLKPVTSITLNGLTLPEYVKEWEIGK